MREQFSVAHLYNCYWMLSVLIVYFYNSTNVHERNVIACCGCFTVVCVVALNQIQVNET